mmetsp:Transcript_19296/g.30162  ORF Transcript_19296/g.30162 Transcript_19296/m.30162 type:complete len:119 (+) Transcript_19296:423-779(+)
MKTAFGDMARPSETFAGESGSMVLALHEGRVVGMQGIKIMEAGTAEMVRWSIAENFRGKGLASSILRSNLIIAKQMKTHRMFSYTANPVAGQILERSGFKVSEKRGPARRYEIELPDI